MSKSYRVVKNIGVAAIAFSCAQIALADWSTKGAQIIDPNGQPFVYRGVNLGIVPPLDSLPFVMEDIAATGANAVRIPVHVGTSTDLLKKYIALCKQHKLVCVLTNVSVYGYGDNYASQYSWSDAWNSWIYVFKDALAGTEDYVAINIASGPTGNSANSQYLGFTETAIFLLRYVGFKHQLIVDGGNWGQDWDFLMRDNAERLHVQDPLGNTVFSVQMYEAYNSPTTIRNYLNSYLDRQLPIIVGEFGPVRRDHPNELNNPYTNNDVDEDAIMQISQELGVGYLGWTWSGNTTNFTDLNMVTNFNPGQLTPWGNKFIHSENGIKATSKLATHYATASSSSSVSSNSSSASSQAENRKPYAVISARVIQERCGSVYAQLSGAESTDPDGDALTYKWEIYNPNNYSYEYLYGKEINFYMRPVIEYSFSLHIDDNKGGTSTATKQLSHSYSDNCIGSSSSSAIIRSSSSSIGQSSSSVPSSVSSSSIRPSSFSSSSSSSSSAIATGNCSYVINSQWSNGFTAAIRIKNTSAQAINGWNVNWQYADGSKVTNLWNASLTGSNPYTAKNLSWNSTIQPGQTVEFGFQGSKSGAVASVPVVAGDICK